MSKKRKTTKQLLISNNFYNEFDNFVSAAAN